MKRVVWSPLPLRRFIGNFESPRYILKWLFISTLIGIVAGIGAIAFYAAIQFATGAFLKGLVGYQPPEPTGEGSPTIMSFWAAAHPWLLPVITTLGGLVAGIIVFSLAPEAEGHGTDAAIAAFHQGKPIRARIPLVKLVASAITIGCGESGGRRDRRRKLARGLALCSEVSCPWTSRTGASPSRPGLAQASAPSSAPPWEGRCWQPKSSTNTTWKSRRSFPPPSPPSLAPARSGPGPAGIPSSLRPPAP